MNCPLWNPKLDSYERMDCPLWNPKLDSYERMDYASMVIVGNFLILDA